MTVKKYKKPKALDLFRSAYGMGFDIRQSDVQVLAGIDNEMECQKTYGTRLDSLACQIGKPVPPGLEQRTDEHIKQIH
jgi:hypothetical protein